MGDRTFSADDVIRIYREFLTEDEMETVEEFFARDEPEPVNVSGAIKSIENLLKLLGNPLIDAVLATFSIVARTALFAATRALRETNNILNNIQEQGGVDA